MEHGTGPVAPPDRNGPVRLWPRHRRIFAAVAGDRSNVVMPPGVTQILRLKKRSVINL